MTNVNIFPVSKETPYHKVQVLPNSSFECREAPRVDELYHQLLDFRNSDNKSVLHVMAVGKGKNPEKNRKPRIILGGIALQGIDEVINADIEKQITVEVFPTEICVKASGMVDRVIPVGEVSRLVCVIGSERERDNGAYHPWYGRTVVYITPDEAENELPKEPEQPNSTLASELRAVKLLLHACYSTIERMEQKFV